MSVDVLVARLKQALSSARKAREHLAQARQAAVEARRILAEATQGSVDPEVGHALGRYAEAAQLTAEIGEVVNRGNTAAETYTRSLTGIGQGASAADPPSTHGAVAASPAKPDPAFVNKHHDRYPPEAANLAAELPKRVVPNNNERTVGRARWRGKPLMTLQSGGGGNVVEDARKLLENLGLPEGNVEYLKYHVEIKFAAAVLKRAFLTDVELAINYTPCGVERRRGLTAECDKVLEKLFPRNGPRSSTVYGTYQDNRPFKKRYGRPGP